MKSYVIKEQTKKEESKPFITDIEEIKDKDGNTTTLGVILAGNSWVPVPYTIENLTKFRESMKEQGKQMQTLLPMKKRNLTKFTTTSIVGVSVLAGTLILNSTELGKEINPLLPSVLGGGIALTGGIGRVVNSRAISYIQKVGIFIKNEALINEYIVTNPCVYYNVSQEDKAKIEKLKMANGEHPIVIENLDELSNKAIITIWNNIKFYKQYKVTNEGIEQGFQKTLGQV